MTSRFDALPRLTVGQLLSVVVILIPVVALYARQQAVGLLVIAAVACLLSRRSGARARTPSRLVPIGALAVLAWGALSLLWSGDPERSLFVLGTMAAVLGAFFLLLWSSDRMSDAERRRMGRAATIAALLGLALVAWEAAIDLAVVKWLWPKIGQTPPRSLVYLNFPLLVLAPLLTFAAAHLAATRRWWVGAALLAAGLALASRLESGTALFGIAAGTAAYLLFAILPLRAVRALSAAALALALLAPPLVGKEVVRLGPVVSLAERAGDSARHRLAIWGGVVDLIRERPALGVGLGAARSLPEGNKKVPLRDADGKVTRLTVELIPTHTHNAGLEITIELGFVGLALVLAALMIALGAAFRIARDRWSTAAVGMLACGAALLWSTGLSVWNSAYLANFAILFAALAAWLARGPREGGDGERSG